MGTFTGDFNYANQTHQSANSGADKSVFALFYPLQGETIDLTSGADCVGIHLMAMRPICRAMEIMVRCMVPPLEKTGMGKRAKRMSLMGMIWIKITHNDSINFNTDNPFSFSLWAVIPEPTIEYSSIFEKWSLLGEDHYPYAFRIHKTSSKRELYFNRTCG